MPHPLVGTLTGEPLRPLKENLQHEIARLERFVASAGLVLSAVGLLLAITVTLTVAKPLGLAISALAGTLVAWFAMVRILLGRGVGTRVVPLVSPFVEITLPSVLMFLDARFQGAQYAAAVSVPLELYAIFVGLQVLRLRRSMPVLVGLVAALEYLALYFLVLRPGLSADLLARPEFAPPLAFMRAAILVLAGIAATFVSLALQRAVGQAASDTRAQELFGKYRLQEKLAAGGMGVVFRALYCPEGGFQRPVALKRVHEHLAENPSFVDAFRAEAELSSRLVHANVVQVLDFGRIGGTYFLAMEYLDGCTLGELMRRSQIAQRWVPELVIVHVGREMLEGLHFAHRVARDDAGRVLRVVHRDLNPPNILLSRAGDVKISDFGIARALGTAAALVTTTLAGKAAYMSPEQARSQAVDERTDLFAAAIILWELVTLRKLFQRENDGASIVAVMEEDAPPASAHRDLPKGWDAFFRRALDKDPARRFQTALEMREALDSLVSGDRPRADDLREFLAALPVPAKDAPAPTSDSQTIREARVA